MPGQRVYLFIITLLVLLKLFYEILDTRSSTVIQIKILNKTHVESTTTSRTTTSDLTTTLPSFSEKIGIIVVVERNTNVEEYKRALDSLSCYSKIYGYDFIIANDTDFAERCPHSDMFFRRHCVVAQHLPKYDYLLFLDADIGVINPKISLTKYIDTRYDVTFYDRFYNQEIVAGSYVIKNSTFALEFIQGFADYERSLPNSFHGTDNGALHIYVLSKLFPTRSDEYKICQEIYNKSQNFEHLFAYESCVRSMLGMAEDFGKIRILRKGTGWCRDIWLTNSMFNPTRDFMFHGLKRRYNLNYSSNELPIKIDDIPDNRGSWYDPIVGEFDLELCLPGNTTWNVDTNLIAPMEEIESALMRMREKIQLQGFNRMGRISTILHEKKLKYPNFLDLKEIFSWFNF